MAISIDSLRAASKRQVASPAKSLLEARNSNIPTAFLCHSHLDGELARGLVALLIEHGWRVYVDWLDSEMPSTPDRKTAELIKKRIVQHDFFLFLATERSTGSRWCPWEIGFADSVKDVDKIFVIPTTGGYTTHGSEYLGLYRRINLSDAGEVGVWRPGDTENGTLLSAL